MLLCKGLNDLFPIYTRSDEVLVMAIFLLIVVTKILNDKL